MRTRILAAHRDRAKGHGETRTFTDVPAGVYNVAETVPDGWTLDSATCDDGSPLTGIDLDPGETITCTFTNSQSPQAP